MKLTASLATLAAGCATFLVATPAWTQAPKATAKSDSPDYPRVNLSPSYEVDPTWPQRPPIMAWGHVPGIAVNKQDHVYVFTRTNPPVQVYTADGKFVRSWGTGIISNAHHLKIDREGHVWITDIGYHVVRKFTADGQMLLTLGTPGRLGDSPRHFNKPTDLAIAPNGDIFVSDGYGNSRIAHFDKQGRFIKAWGTLGTGSANFSIPHAIACDSKGTLYVADRNNVRVQVYDRAGRLTSSWRDVIVPWGFWMTADDEVWVCGSSPMAWTRDAKYPTAPLGCPPKDQVFMRFNTTGKLLQLWTVPKGEDDKEQPGDLNWLHCIALDSKGNIYAGDIMGKRAQKFVRKQ